MVAIKVWGLQLKGSRFHMKCDNTVALSAMNMKRTHNKVAQAIMREIAYWRATYQVEVFTMHVEEWRNEVADSLSRWHVNETYRTKFHNLVNNLTVKEIKIKSETFGFTGEWI